MTVWLRVLLLAWVAASAGGVAAQADPAKVLHVVFRAAETGFDPQVTSDIYSGYANRVIFEPLYRYDYRARPHRVVPNTAAALPEGTDDGRQWTIKIRPGIHFTDDPAFLAKPRELTAADYAYSWKRVLDPKTRSPLLELFGYVDRDGDGWRDLPDGRPLVLKRGTSPSALERQYDELWQRNMTAIGVRIEMVTQKWPDSQIVAACHSSSRHS